MEYNSPEFRQWLDKLQQESWQLELLISGFAILGLFSAIDVVDEKATAAAASEIIGFTAVWGVAFICILIFIFNLVLHVLLRGLWIGAIGLRYVSGDIDYSKLNYSDKFTSYLKRKVGSFDRYISRLENYCSILFSITFLLVFYVIGFVAVLAAVLLLVSLIKNLEFIPEDISKYIRGGFGVIFGLSALIVFVDFISQGFLKKKKWTTKLYFPIYWVFSKLTLSFLYRPIAYNFLDNRLGRKVSMFLLPVYIAILFISSFDYYNSNYLFILSGSNQNVANNLNYDDEITEKTQFVDFASIPSKVVHSPYLKVFIPFSTAKEDFVYEIDKDLKPEDDVRGFGTGFTVGMQQSEFESDEKTKNETLAKYIGAINKLYHLRVDSILHTSDFIIAKNAKQRVGFETYLDIEELSKGKHFLTIHGPEKIASKKDSIDFDSRLITIPFWYFPENRIAPIVENKTEIDSTTNK